MIEIIKDHCPACKLTKFNTDNLSLKLDKHQLLEKIPFYRMKITNQIPWLGDFPHSPLHLYVKKEGADIVEMKLLNSPIQQAKVDSFISELKEKTGIENFDEKIKYDFVAQYSKQVNQLDLQEDFDFDFDGKDGYVPTPPKPKKPES